MNSASTHHSVDKARRMLRHGSSVRVEALYQGYGLRIYAANGARSRFVRPASASRQQVATFATRAAAVRFAKATLGATIS